jgi:hypothetical protein
MESLGVADVDALEELGRGTYAVAYRLPDGRVLKVTTDPRSVRAAKIVLDAGPGPGVVHVYDVKRLADGTFWATVEEHLLDRERLSEDDQLDLDAAAGTVQWLQLDSRKLRAAATSLRAAGRALDRDYPDTANKAQAVKWVMEIARGISWLMDHGVRGMSDFHEGNVGIRTDGSAVVFDLSSERIRRSGEIGVAANAARKTRGAKNVLAGKVMYHGTTAKFAKFSAEHLSPTGAFGSGFYFTNDHDLASQYSDGGEPIAAHLTLKRPWVVDLDDRETRSETGRPFRAVGSRERLMAEGYDGVLVKQGDYLEAIVYEPSQIEIIGRGTEPNPNAIGESTITGLRFLWDGKSGDWRLTGVHERSGKTVFEIAPITLKRRAADLANRTLASVVWDADAEKLDVSTLVRAIDDLNEELDAQGLTSRRTPYARRTPRMNPKLVNNSSKMPRVAAAFDQCFEIVRVQFPDFGEIELHQDEKAAADNGHGSERQFGYCMDGDPIRIAFARKTEDLPEANINGLVAHEFGHALDNRYGDDLPELLGCALPGGAERRADAIAKEVFGKTIKYDSYDVQCVACRGQAPRPRRLGA